MISKAAFELRVPFFRPMWRRGIVAALLLMWTLFEALNGNWVWAALFAAATLWVAYQFFVVFEAGPALSEEDDI